MNLDKVYTEASQWVRMCNAILWAMGTFLVPISVGCIGLAYQHPKEKYFLAVASLFLFAMWVYVSFLYRRTAADARKALIAIEDLWGIADGMALYRLHGQVGLQWFSLFNVQVCALVFLIGTWVLLMIRGTPVG